ncbi:MAG: Beta-lactamase [Clostridia bacterium]|jgi:metallo-beta-lactamase class B|nr:Beta-lactamase [Clostridia bacterium]
MKRIYLLLCLILTVFALTSCTSKEVKSINTAPPEEVLASGTTDSSYVELTKINESLWVHTSYENYNGSRTPSNGMLAVTQEGLILIDTPWNNEQTKELIKLAKEKFNQDIALAIITHAHSDRIGGIDTLLENKIDVRSTAMTIQQAEKNGFSKPSPKLDENPNIILGGVSLEVFYPGEGHTSDNITVWFPEYKVLFGGCLIKSVESKDAGSTGDANLAQWPDSVSKVKERYPDAEIVIPGHGKWGGMELINHTLELLGKNAK